ncbi:MAG TPA: nitrilase-related carbon-nitrogen hydrolase [Solirubrobacteraceae bacterium]|nr:nitrilase-related carbon-nitrogen hydrolase [Solirubrobacteraceae bacterium]
MAETPHTRICVQQLDPRVGDPDHNRMLSLAAIEQAAAARAQVVVLPELVNSGYVFTSAEEAASLAIPAEDPLIGEWTAAARRHGLVLAAGFCERAADGRTYNSAVLIDPDGVRAVYRKLHLWDREKLWFTAGEALPPVLDTTVGRVSLVICYDLEFPELTRTLALAGVDLLLVPTNWPLMPRPGDERPGEVINAMATARLNHIAVACADRCGVEREQPWTGASTIVDADGWAVGETPWRAGADRRPGPLYADVYLARSRDKRFTELADALADRRPELYGAVVRSESLAVS